MTRLRFTHRILRTALALGVATTVRAQAANAATPNPAQGTAPVTIAAPATARPVVAPLQRLVTLDLHDVPLEVVLDEIDRQAHIGIQYTPRTVPVDKRVSIRATRTTVASVLHRVLEGTGVEVITTAEGEVMLVATGKKRVSADSLGTGNVIGRVTDSSTAQALVGARVSVRATTLSTVTNDQGYYLLQHVPVGMHVVVVQYLGYTLLEREVAVVGDSTYPRNDFALSMNMSRLQEVVSTATGPQRRLELGNDITVLNADSIVATQPVTSVTNLLDGRVPGLTVEHSSGTPGDPARLRLRGTSSANLNNDPIVIVDGMRVYSAQSDNRSRNLAAGAQYNAPSPLDYIDPHSIETIEVLKGPSAATLYGADAANGVIVISTKRGHAGPPRWTASMDHGVTEMPGAYPVGYLRWGHLPYSNAPMLCPISNLSCVADSVSRFQVLNDPALTVLGSGNRTAATLGVSGGSDALQYSVNGQYTDETGLLRLPTFEIDRFRANQGVSPPDWMQNPDRLRQWGASTNLTASLGSKASVGLTAMLSRLSQQRSSLESQLTGLMTTYLDRSTGKYYQVPPFLPVQLVQADALLSGYYTRVTDEATTFTSGMNANWRPMSWLTATTDAGLNVIQRDDALLTPNGLSPTADSNGVANTGRGSSLVGTVNARATATAPLPWGMHLQTSLGVNYTDQTTADLSVATSDIAPGATSVGGAGHIDGIGEARTEMATFGWYVEPTLAAKRFWLSTGMRFDGGNSFGSHASLAGFPKVSASYLVSDEPFFPFKKIFNTLRLRLAYGHAGVQPGPGDRLRLFSTPTSVWSDGQFVTGVDLKSLGNTQLKPERSTELEGGFDADLLDDRVSLSVTGYRKTRVDALMLVPLPPSIDGGSGTLQNIGKIRNSGFEISVRTQLVRSDPVTWSIDTHVSHDQSLVLTLGSGVVPFGSPDQRIVAGYPLFGRWGRPVIGYNDASHNGILDANEILYGDSLVYLGASEPNYSAGLSMTLSLFRGTVAVSADFTYSSGLAESSQWSLMTPISRGLNDPTASLAEQAAVISALGNGGFNDFLNTQSVNTLRFNSLSIAYRVPVSIAQRVGARALTVALQGSNLALHTSYRGLDPDVGYGTDRGELPQPRTWQVRVSANY